MEAEQVVTALGGPPDPSAFGTDQTPWLSFRFARLRLELGELQFPTVADSAGCLPQ
ncbi:hypothetical protein D3C85_1346600 [compost metagenome]